MGKRGSRLMVVLLVSAGTVLPIGTASATTLPTPLSPGESVSPLVAVGDFITQVYASDTVSFGVAGSGPVGSLFEAVTNAPVNNPTGLNFAFLLNLTSGNVASMEIPGYGGWSVAVAYCNFNGVCFQGSNPTSAALSSDGSTVTFSWSTALTGNSGYFDIYTNAPSFVDAPSIQIFDTAGDVSTVSAFFVPATPLPAALPVFATGLGALGLLGWRKKRKNATAIAAA